MGGAVVRGIVATSAIPLSDPGTRQSAGAGHEDGRKRTEVAKESTLLDVSGQYAKTREIPGGEGPPNFGMLDVVAGLGERA